MLVLHRSCVHTAHQQKIAAPVEPFHGLNKGLLAKRYVKRLYLKCAAFTLLTLYPSPLIFLLQSCQVWILSCFIYYSFGLVCIYRPHTHNMKPCFEHTLRFHYQDLGLGHMILSQFPTDVCLFLLLEIREPTLTCCINKPNTPHTPFLNERRPHIHESLRLWPIYTAFISILVVLRVVLYTTPAQLGQFVLHFSLISLLLASCFIFLIYIYDIQRRTCPTDHYGIIRVNVVII